MNNKINYLVLVCTLFFSLVSNADTPIRIFDGFICLPDNYYFFNANSNEHGISSFFASERGNLSNITTGLVEFAPDPTTSEVMPWVEADRSNINGLTTIFYKVDEKFHIKSARILSKVLIMDSEEFLMVYDDGKDIWRLLMNTLDDTPNKACNK
jgi:hypothetical protein